MSWAVTVLDWRTDFKPGRTIMHQIEEASARCSAGIFLFTGDDQLADDLPSQRAVPRDNVVFEAGYFINAKGKDHVLIVRQASAKMPADLGGDIYASFRNSSSISPLKTPVRRFLRGL
jgi:predicted nucleotide-binding protein